VSRSGLPNCSVVRHYNEPAVDRVGKSIREARLQELP
jgi:hypothetical protein